MARIEVINLERELNQAGGLLSAQIRWGRRTRKVWLHSQGAPITLLADPLLPLALPVAMRCAAPLWIDGAVSSRLLRGAVAVQQIFSSWYPHYRRVRVETAKQTEARPADVQGVAAFFSGGVDSFHTLAQRRNELTHLILVHGFDIALRRRTARARVSASCQEVASTLGLELVEVSTNLREFGQSHVSWLETYYGAALAAVATLIAPTFRRIYIPGGNALSQLRPEATHPELDPLWSNEAMQLVHDGADCDRFAKILAVADWPLTRAHLRVCYQPDAEGGNCGRCRKCLWTMQVLAAAGCLKDCQTFPDRLDLRALRRYPVTLKHQRDRFQQGLTMLRNRNAEPELQRLLEEMLAPGFRPPLIARAGRWLSRARNYMEFRLPSREGGQ